LRKFDGFNNREFSSVKTTTIANCIEAEEQSRAFAKQKGTTDRFVD